MKYLLIFFFSTSLLSAQNSKQISEKKLDSLYNAIILLHNPETTIKGTNQIAIDQAPVKCGFGTIADVKTHFDSFTPEQQNSINQVLSRPELQTNKVSPSGIFRIHYDTTGNYVPDYFNGIKNTIQLSVDSLAIAFDSSYNYEVNILGYDAPPSDGTEGGDGLYDVYIKPVNGYGYTEPVKLGPTYIVVDNKMNFYTKGIHAARVTAAHEFHHAIQVGSYSDNTSGNRYYFEITSTAMEEFVYDSVNDYYGYLLGYFNKPDKRFTYFVKRKI